jgi:hypothetical protein
LTTQLVGQGLLSDAEALVPLLRQNAGLPRQFEVLRTLARGCGSTSWGATVSVRRLGWLPCSQTLCKMAIQADSFAPAPSYVRNGICGEGTAYACPNRYVPMPSRASLHIGPDDQRLPDSVRAQQGINQFAPSAPGR